MKLTPHFTLDELIRSDDAKRFGIDNVPTTEHLANLQVLALGLEQARLLLGCPMVVTSGYRCPELNTRIYAEAGKPATNSAHSLGFAADFHCYDAKRDFRPPLVKSARSLQNLIVYDQLIYEPGRCVHISFDPRLRMQVMTQRVIGGPTVQGIVE